MRGRRPGRVEIGAVLALPLGLGLVLAGQALEGGGAHILFQQAAALIVFGGTAGAVCLSFPMTEVRKAVASLRWVFVDAAEPVQALIARMVRYAYQARRAGVMMLEQELDDEPDPFVREGLGLAVDGAGPNVIRHVLEVKMDALASEDETAARVYESAGGYAPTLGILGAVLGLIQVMENLADPSKLGPGIAIAFVATVYGVGVANLFLLPVAARLRERARASLSRRELVLEGVLAIQEGLNPRLVEQRLWSYVGAQEARRPPTVPGGLPTRVSAG